MKDAFGHGSNPKGRGPYLRPDGRGVIPSRPFRAGGDPASRNMASDQDAAQALKSKMSAAPVHPAMTSNMQANNSLISTLRATMQKHPVEKYRGNPL